MLYWLLRPIIHGIFWVFFGFRSFGTNRVPVQGGAILASNHQSFLDPMILGLGLPRRVWYIARSTLFTNPLFGRFIRSVGAFPIDRDGADISAMRTITGLLRDGKLLVMFPEGTRTRDGSIGPCKAGVAVSARAADVPVIPVAIDGAHEAWPRGRKFPRPFRRIRVIYGEPVKYAKGTGRHEVESDLRLRLESLLALLRARRLDRRAIPAGEEV